MAIVAFLALTSAVVSAEELGPEEKRTPAVVTGWFRDLTCLMRYKQVARPLNDCAKMCALNNAPLVIATADGQLYTPISSAIPEVDQRAKLMPHVGRLVRVTGRTFERSGMRAISIEKIEDVPGPADK